MIKIKQLEHPLISKQHLLMEVKFMVLLMRFQANLDHSLEER
jgi:hypothetical protein